MRHSRERIGQVARHEKVDLLLSDDIADGPANPSSLGRPYRVGQHQEVDVPPLFPSSVPEPNRNTRARLS